MPRLDPPGYSKRGRPKRNICGVTREDDVVGLTTDDALDRTNWGQRICYGDPLVG